MLSPKTAAISVCLYYLFTTASIQCMGSLPDASQEGLLQQFRGYSSLAVFHYTVPPEVNRATWEFASFQDRKECPHREVNIFIQHGSYPVFSGDNSSFPETFLLDRTSLSHFKTVSDYQPEDSVVHPVYNPQPGSWYAVAYLSPFEENHGLLQKCRYSLGSIALWTRAETVDLILPNLPQSFRTRKHFSYYKFHVSDDVDVFKLVLHNCQVKIRQPRPNLSSESCIDFVDIRAGAFPFNRHSSSTGKSNISSADNATFFEPRPHKSTTYYMIVVSHGEVTFEVNLAYRTCGETGLYGKQQREWYLSERGLMWSDKYNTSSTPKEPETGFQLFTTRPHSKILNLTEGVEKNFAFEGASEDEGEGESNVTSWTAEDEKSLEDICLATFDFTRIDNVAEYTVSYLLQGRSWYTKWLTVLEQIPLLTRFDTLDFIDLGGFVNIRLKVDDRYSNDYTYQVIEACLSRKQRPDMQGGCDADSMISLSNKDSGSARGTKVIPYPEPGKWYLGFNMHCMNRTSGLRIVCPRRFRAGMISVDLHIQPCGYRSDHNYCGDYGVCAKASKGQFRFSSCSCFSGYRGWTCDDSSFADPGWKFKMETLLLTLSNFAFLPAICYALYYRLFTEALIYSATMIFSTFYHTCDQEAYTLKLPETLQSACMAFYVNREVLQFCDFYSATLSFWITIISLAKLPYRLVTFLHIFGVLLVAVLVQYNRTGISIFVIPIPLGLLVLLISLVFKSWRRRRCYKPNKMCLLLFAPALLCATVAITLFGFIETSGNYPYVHSTWHLLMAVSLIFLLPRCRRSNSSNGSNRNRTGTALPAGKYGKTKKRTDLLHCIHRSPTCSSESSIQNEDDRLGEDVGVEEDEDEDDDGNTAGTLTNSISSEEMPTAEEEEEEEEEETAIETRSDEEPSKSEELGKEKSSQQYKKMNTQKQGENECHIQASAV